MAVFAPRYAHALAQVIDAKKLDIAAAQQQMRDFAGTLSGSSDLREVLLNPSIPQDQKLRLLDAIAGRMGMFREIRNFIAVIMDHHRLAAFDEIIAEYDLVADEDSGIAEAEITSAHPLHSDDRAALEEQVAKLAGGRVRASYREDSSLLGGAIVRIGSTVYDGSVLAQLQQLKTQLINA
ncbi:ATP synthase F1 subunit delta [Granulicella arctica]|uniref:ATP synthase F1 subunit delta n=1 Tax=Granulicella arctica TaxID=940613 RepID=UPI0021DF9BB3|nr:ATP synthase F1 subunit delta [Granulicella arctica]